MEKESKNEKISSILFVVQVLIILFARYGIDNTLRIYYLGIFLKIIIYLFTAINTIIILTPIIRSRKIKSINIWAILAMIVYYCFTAFYNYDGSISFDGLLMAYLWCLFCISPREVQKKTFTYLRNSFFYISIIGIICYFSFAFNLFIPYNKVIYYTLWSNNYYIDYGIVFLYQNGSIIRLCGICNEPGYFGTILGLLLCASNIKIWDKKNLTFFIAGLLTFSLAFLIIFFVYLLLKTSNDKKAFIITIVLLMFYFFVFPNIHTNNENINSLINRLSITSEGLSGDNRSNDALDYLFEQSLETKPWFGYGNGFVRSRSIIGVLSYKTYIINFGIVGCLMFWGLLLLGALQNNKKQLNVIFYTLVFFLSIYQRPSVMSLPYCVILFGGILYIKEFSNNVNHNQKEIKTERGVTNE